MTFTIQIPDNAKCLFKIGQIVNFNDPFYEFTSSNDVKIPISKKLGIKPSSIFQYIKKFVGENIKIGDVLGIKKGLLATKKIISDYDGIIKEIDHNDGSMVISTTVDSKNTKKSFFKAEITEINKNEVVCKIQNSKEFAFKYSSADFGGEVYYLFDEKKRDSLTASEISNKIIVADSVSSYTQSKAEALGIAGYVTLNKLEDETSLSAAQLKKIEDLEKIKESLFPYCMVDNKSGKIYFYK